MSFKLCHYVTGNPKWQEEYSFLIEHPSFRYLDLIAKVWKRWEWLTFNEDYDVKMGLFKLDVGLNPS